MSRPRTAHPAFSLVELVLVLAIMGVLAAVAAPKYSAAIANYRVKLAAHRVASDVALTQAAAKASSASRVMAFNTVTHRYTVSGVAALDGKSGGYAVALASEPYSVAIKTLTFTNAGAGGALTFDGYGVPNGGLTLVLSYGTYTRTMVVDQATGIATVQ